MTGDRAPSGHATTGRLFDRYVMVDWSASSVPTRGKDSIWIATLDHHHAAVPGEAGPRTTSDRATVTNHPTRTSARRMLRAEAAAAVAEGRRLLIGVDVPFGYPAGTAAALGLDTTPDRPPWRAMWDELAHMVRDDIDGRPNRSNRFEVAAVLNARLAASRGMDPDGTAGPFWGCPVGQRRTTLSTHKGVFPFPTAGGDVAEFRLAERALQSRRLRPFSVWQTAYAGSVGSQALTAIPVLHELLTAPELGGCVDVWPFTTGFGLDGDFATQHPDRPNHQPEGGRIVLVEIWPGAVHVPATSPPGDPAAALDGHPVKDARQVTALCRWVAGRDVVGTLADVFSRSFDRSLLGSSMGDQLSAVITEEGWVLWDPDDHPGLGS